MNKEQREELKRLAAEATPGPWINGSDEDSDYSLVGPAAFDEIVANPVVTLHSEINAAYIAAANPQAITALLASLEAAEKALESNKAQWLSWEAKRASLEKDAARLDWIEKTSQRGHYCGVFRGNLLTRSSIDKEMA